MPNVHELIRDHVTLSIRCLIAWTSMRTCRSSRPPAGCATSFAITWVIHRRPRCSRRCSIVSSPRPGVRDHANVPLVSFERGQRKDDVVAAYRARHRRRGGGGDRRRARKMRAFKAQEALGLLGRRLFTFSRQSVAVNHYSFYVQDPEWGPAFRQARHVHALSDRAVSQRPRVGQAAVAPRRNRF